MSKKKKIKRLERENADLRERLKYIEGYFTASNVVIKAFDKKSMAESFTNALSKKSNIPTPNKKPPMPSVKPPKA